MKNTWENGPGTSPLSVGAILFHLWAIWLKNTICRSICASLPFPAVHQRHPFTALDICGDQQAANHEISRLSEAAGAPVVFTLRALPYGRVQELKRLTEEADIQILLAGCAEPDLKAAALQEKFQGVTPAETIKAMLLPGEIADLSIAVEKLSGYRRTTIEEVKNG